MRKWQAIMRRPAARLISDRRGGVAILTAMSMTGLMGFAGLGTEVTMWYVAKRNMQATADAAAYSAAKALAAGETSTQFIDAAYAVASQYGYTNGSGNVTVAVHNGTNIVSTNYVNNLNAIEVIVSQQQPMLFSKLFMSSAPTISSVAVALNQTAAGGTCTTATCACVMALDPSSSTSGLSDSGTGSIDLNGCNVDVNSGSSSALNMSGGATISAQQVNIVGNKSLSGGSSITTTGSGSSGGTNTGGTAVPDPYSSFSIPSTATNSCSTSYQTLGVPGSSGTHTIGPTTSGGVCVIGRAGISVSQGETLNLNPGIYIIDTTTTGGGLNVQGTLTGSDVTIILTSSNGDYGTVQISGTTGTVNLSAPTPGSSAASTCSQCTGMAMYVDRNAPSSDMNSISGSASSSITGALYFPSTSVTYGGTSFSNSGSNCTQLIAYTISLTGSSTFNSSSCQAEGVAGFSGSGGSGTGTVTTALVE